MVSNDVFLQAYGNVLISAWGNPEVKTRLKSEPEVVLKEYGLDPGSAKIQLKTPGHASDDATPESQVQLWNDGLQSGTIDFYFPEEPPEGVEGMELSEEELAQVAGGGWKISCCSCTPCCCC